jgi:error-prone DNA polymerase
MSMLPRLKPREFFDLVIEVAIVRPGPIQGDMVHPYLRRRMGLEPPQYPRGLEEVLGRTYGVPLFQEQAMKIAMIAAGFTAGEADGLRRAMATFRRNGDIVRFEEKFIAGMIANDYEPDFARRCFEQIKGFSDYGFPLSHAASFALLVYVSTWLKCFHPEVFACALLNSQPMGFYAPAQIVRDAQAHGVEVRPADVNLSDWDCTLETTSDGDKRRALRLGFREVKGLAQVEIEEKLVARRGIGFSSVANLQYRAHLSRRALEHLADADAFRSLGLDRRHALWAVKGLRDYASSRSAPQKAGESPLVEVRSRVLRQAQDEVNRDWPLPRAIKNGPHPELVERRASGFAKPSDRLVDTSLPLFAPLAGESPREPAVRLPPMGLGEHVLQDYRTTGLSLKEHPLALLRGMLEDRRILPNGRLRDINAGKTIRVAGLVLIRQQPGSAKGVIFMTLEDETGIANIIVWRKTFERFRPIVMGARLVQCEGPEQREGEVIHVVAHRLIDLSPLLRRLSDPAASRPEELTVQSRDFR